MPIQKISFDTEIKKQLVENDDPILARMKNDDKRVVGTKVQMTTQGNQKS
jgi:hypothetical protein